MGAGVKVNEYDGELATLDVSKDMDNERLLADGTFDCVDSPIDSIPVAIAEVLDGLLENSD